MSSLECAGSTPCRQLPGAELFAALTSRRRCLDAAATAWRPPRPFRSQRVSQPRPRPGSHSPVCFSLRNILPFKNNVFFYSFNVSYIYTTCIDHIYPPLPPPFYLLICGFCSSWGLSLVHNNQGSYHWAESPAAVRSHDNCCCLITWAGQMVQWTEGLIALKPCSLRPIPGTHLERDFWHRKYQWYFVLHMCSHWIDR